MAARARRVRPVRYNGRAMPGETCDYGGCKLQIRERCTSCGSSFCTRHLHAYSEFQGGPMYRCLCCEEVTQAAIRQEARAADATLCLWGLALLLFVGGIAVAATIWPVGGLLMISAGIGLGVIVFVIGVIKGEKGGW